MRRTRGAESSINSSIFINNILKIDGNGWKWWVRVDEDGARKGAKSFLQMDPEPLAFFQLSSILDGGLQPMINIHKP